MFYTIIKCLVFLSPLTLITPTEGFWWRSSTTEAPQPAPAMKQIPLTYFRTYTYQPMAANPLPFPLMSSTDYITNYAALANNPYFNPMMSLLPQAVGAGGGGIAVAAPPGTANDEMMMAAPMAHVGGGVRPAKSYEGVHGIRYPNGEAKITSTSTTTSTTTTTTPKPTTTTSTTQATTTPTTTTTPKPTTTTSTSTTSTTSTTDLPSTTKPYESASTAPFIKTDAMVNIEAAYPAFNRKVYTNHFNINYNRPVYPYPEYSIYKSVNTPNNIPLEENSPAPPIQPAAATPNIEYVPCMCPVNIQNGYPAGIPIAGNPSNSIFLAQSRAEPEEEASMELPAADVAEPANVEAISEEVPLTNFVDDLQMIKMDGEDEAAVTQSLVAS